MNRKNKRNLGIVVTVFIVAILLSSTSAIPLKNNEAIENNLKNMTKRNTEILRKKIQEKLDNDEILKEVIKEKYPELYDAITSGILVNFPIFCWSTLLVVFAIATFWMNRGFPRGGTLAFSVWCMICWTGFWE